MMKSVEQRILDSLRSIVEELGITCSEAEQDNRMVRQVALKKSKQRTYCYVLFRDQVHEKRMVNLVFRLPSDLKPAEVFLKENSLPDMAANWVARMIRPWSKEAGTPRWAIEAARATDQWGICLTERDIEHPDFHRTLSHFLLCTVNAAG